MCNFTYTNVFFLNAENRCMLYVTQYGRTYKLLTIHVYYTWPIMVSAILTHGHTGQFPGVPTNTGAMLIYVCCVQHVFLLFKHWFYWKYQYNRYMFIFIDIYSFIPVSGCVGMVPSALLCPGAHNAAKTALIIVGLTSYWPSIRAHQTRRSGWLFRLGFNEIAQFLSKSEVLVALSVFSSQYFSHQ